MIAALRKLHTATPAVAPAVASATAALLLNLGIVMLLVNLQREHEIQVTREPSRIAVLRQIPEPPPDLPPPDTDEAPPPDTAPPAAELPPPWPPEAAYQPLSTPAIELSALPPLGLLAPRMLNASSNSRPAADSRPPPEPAAPEPAPQGPMESNEVDTPPREQRDNPKPTFPRIAERRQLSGSVTLRLLVGTDGRVKKKKVLECHGHASFRSEVDKVLPRLRFSHPSHRGKPVEVWVRKTFQFRWSRR